MKNKKIAYKSIVGITVYESDIDRAIKLKHSNKFIEIFVPFAYCLLAVQLTRKLKEGVKE